MELVRNVDSVKVGLVALQEVDDVPLSLGKADPDVEGVNLLGDLKMQCWIISLTCRLSTHTKLFTTKEKSMDERMRAFLVLEGVFENINCTKMTDIENLLKPEFDMLNWLSVRTCMQGKHNSSRIISWYFLRINCLYKKMPKRWET